MDSAVKNSTNTTVPMSKFVAFFNSLTPQKSETINTFVSDCKGVLLGFYIIDFEGAIFDAVNNGAILIFEPNELSNDNFKALKELPKFCEKFRFSVVKKFKNDKEAKKYLDAFSEKIRNS